MNPSPGGVHSCGPAPSLFPIVAFRLLLLLPLSCCLLLGGSHQPLAAVSPSPPFTGDWSWLRVFPFISLFPSSQLTSAAMKQCLQHHCFLIPWPCWPQWPSHLLHLNPIVVPHLMLVPKGSSSETFTISLFLWFWLPNVWPLLGFSSIFLSVSQWLPPWLLAHSTWTTWLIIRRILCITPLLPWFSATTVQWNSQPDHLWSGYSLLYPDFWALLSKIHD